DREVETSFRSAFGDLPAADQRLLRIMVSGARPPLAPSGDGSGLEDSRDAWTRHRSIVDALFGSIVPRTALRSGMGTLDIERWIVQSATRDVEHQLARIASGST